MSEAKPTCGYCRDCRHWKPPTQDHDRRGLCLLATSAAQYPLPDYGCVLFEAKPKLQIVKALVIGPKFGCDEALTPELLPLYQANLHWAVPLGDFTHYVRMSDEDEDGGVVLLKIALALTATPAESARLLRCPKCGARTRHIDGFTSHHQWACDGFGSCGQISGSADWLRANVEKPHE